MMELKAGVALSLSKGYKQTEIGLIPSDWEVKTLGELGKFSKGSGVRKDEALSGDIPCIRYGELYTRHSDYIKQFYSFISKDIAITAKKLKVGDILFAGSGETKEEIGKSVAFVNDFEAYAGGDIVILSPITADTLYLGYLLNAPFIQKQKASRGQGDAVVHISATQLGNIKIPLPPTIAEQTLIATALSDADALISSLEKLIAKKRNIKQGAMQKLLQPKEGWEVKKLGEVAEIYTGKKNNQDKVENGTYPFFVRSQTVESINSYSFDGEAILIPGEGNIGKIFHYINGKFDYHQRVYKISDFKDGYFGKYIYRYISEYFGRHAMENSVKATVDSLRLPTFQVFEIPFPLTMNEQVEISNILSDMDAEITTLETKLEKYKKVKLGMMQNLMTGKIRLV